MPRRVYSEFRLRENLVRDGGSIGEGSIPEERSRWSMVEDGKILSAFRRYLSLVRSMHPQTVRERVRNVESWLVFLEERGKGLAEADTDDAIEWWEGQLRRYGTGTLQHVLSSLRAFYAWLGIESKRPPQNPFALFRVRHHRGSDRPWTDEEGIRRMRAVPDGGRALDLRNRALFEVLVSTLGRVSEVCGLDVGDIRWGERRVLFRHTVTKTGEPRTALLTDLAARSLRAWLRVRPMYASPESGDAVFIGRHGRRLTRNTAHEIIRARAQKAGLFYPVSPHGIRKSIATQAMNRGADLLSLKELLGHAEARSTEHYLAYQHNRKLDEAARFHPFAGAAEVAPGSDPFGEGGPVGGALLDELARLLLSRRASGHN